jgi:hypothetical protein
MRIYPAATAGTSMDAIIGGAYVVGREGATHSNSYTPSLAQPAPMS